MPDVPMHLIDSAPTGFAQLIADGTHLEQVIRRGILEATVSVDIMTADFKAMLVPDRGLQLARGRRSAPSIVERLARLAERGVEVRILHAGVPSGPALEALKRLGGAGSDRLSIRRCPRLHAKAVIIDAQQVYVGSANLTGAGLGAKSDRNRNHELGVWTTSEALVDAVSQYFNRLWEGDRCVDCGRKDVCPVPLEEPDL